MTETGFRGRVKFYSNEKGYGFIACEGTPDVFFHITSVKGDVPPKTGEVVKFHRSTHSGRDCAIDVTIIGPKNWGQPIEDAHPIRKLSGFPCVRGDTIKGFTVTHNFGRIESTGIFFNSSGHRSMSDAQQALVRKARSIGANAVTNYFYHRTRVKREGIFGSEWETRYWAEGTAVTLTPL